VFNLCSASLGERRVQGGRLYETWLARCFGQEHDREACEWRVVGPVSRNGDWAVMLLLLPDNTEPRPALTSFGRLFWSLVVLKQFSGIGRMPLYRRYAISLDRPRFQTFGTLHLFDGGSNDV
jgi:hypothetical protein